MQKIHIISKMSIIIYPYESLANQSIIACNPFSLIARNTLKVIYPTTKLSDIARTSIIKAKAHKTNICGVILSPCAIINFHFSFEDISSVYASF